MKRVTVSNLKRIIVVFVATVCTGVTDLCGQYTDHRNRQIDSLEQVLQINPPEGLDLARIYRDLAWGYIRFDIERSMDYARKCIELCIPLDSWATVANCYKLLGMNYYRISQYDSAMAYYDKALAAAERMKDFKYAEIRIDDEFSLIYASIGNLYNTQGKNHEAVEYYTKALKLFEKHDWVKSQGMAYYNIGEMYLSMGNYEQAEVNYRKLNVIAHEVNDSMFIAYANRGLSMVQLNYKEYDKAKEYAEAAREYFFAHKEEGTYQVSILNVLARIYLFGYNDIERAEQYVRQALELIEVNEVILVEQAVSLGLLASVYLHHGQWRQSEQIALEALAVDESKPANTMGLYEILSKAYAHLGNAAKSAEYFDKHHALQASYSNKHYQSAIREMEVKYETEKKETRIATLEEEKRLMMWLGIAGAAVLFLALTAFFFLWRWTVQKRRLADQQVKQLEQEKQLVATQALLDGETQERTRLARDLHDGLGSMLTSIRLGLENMRNEELNGSIGMINDSMVELRRIAHHLMPASLSRDGLKTALTDFFRTLPCVQFTYFGSEERIDPKMEMMIYRIIHELVNNALKYSGASGINVQVIQEQGYIAFTVSDDGCGFDPDAETKGMGLRNIRDRVASYNGRILIDSSPGKGTEVNVELRT